MLDFTIDEIDSLIEFIDCCFIENIRNDVDIDNMNYVANIGSIYHKLYKERKRLLDEKEGFPF